MYAVITVYQSIENSFSDCSNRIVSPILPFSSFRIDYCLCTHIPVYKLHSPFQHFLYISFYSLII